MRHTRMHRFFHAAPHTEAMEMAGYGRKRFFPAESGKACDAAAIALNRHSE